MASPLQNRLVGTIILVALAVIILPDVLDGEKAETVEAFETIPLQPEQNTALKQPQPLPSDVSEQLQQAALPQQPEVAKTAEEAQPITLADNEKNQLKAPPREPQEFAADGEAYVVQLGAFSQADSVEALVKQLREQGFAAYSEPAGNLTKLLVGPDTSAEALKKQLPILQQLTGLKGEVLRYNPS